MNIETQAMMRISWRVEYKYNSSSRSKEKKIQYGSQRDSSVYKKPKSLNSYFSNENYLLNNMILFIYRTFSYR